MFFSAVRRQGMFGMGTMESVAIVLLILLIGTAIWLTFFLKKKYPNNSWIGFILSFLLPPIGQLYLAGALPWIIVLFACYIFFQGFHITIATAWLLTAAVSGIIMCYRLLKQAKAPKEAPAKLPAKKGKKK